MKDNERVIKKSRPATKKWTQKTEFWNAEKVEIRSNRKNYMPTHTNIY